MHQIVRLGLRPRHHYGSLQRSFKPLAAIRGLLLKQVVEGGEGKGKGEERTGGKGKVKGKERRKGRENREGREGSSARPLLRCFRRLCLCVEYLHSYS